MVVYFFVFSFFPGVSLNPSSVHLWLWCEALQCHRLNVFALPYTTSASANYAVAVDKLDLASFTLVSSLHLAVLAEEH